MTSTQIASTSLMMILNKLLDFFSVSYRRITLDVAPFPKHVADAVELYIIMNVFYPD